MEYSISPDGEKFELPGDDDYTREYERLKKLVAAQKELGHEIVVVMGLGFVGAVMAAVVADTVDKKTGKPNKFVIGMQRPSPRSFWKIHLFNRGLSPVSAEDPDVAPMIDRCVNQKKTLTATFTYDALRLADVLVVDVQCDFLKQELGNLRSGHADISALEQSFKIIGERIDPRCLVLIETTVPPGTTEYVAYPLIKKAFMKRGIEDEPLLTHSFERIMPGKDYVKSVREFWRVCSGINGESKERVTRFLSEIVDVERYPMTVLDKPVESETCKIVENSYRATILAFLNEWSLFAETNGPPSRGPRRPGSRPPRRACRRSPGPGGPCAAPRPGGRPPWTCAR